MAKKRTATFLGSQLGLTVTPSGYAYAYNEIGTGQLQSIANTLSFTTGDYVFVGKWTVSGSINSTGVSGTGGIDQFYLKLNGTVVMSLKTDTAEEDMPNSFVVPVIIPPLTKVEALAVCALNNDVWLVSNTLTGRVYDA